MKILRIILITAFIAFITSFAYSETHLYLFASGNHFLTAGTEDDYEPGVNDFPIMEAHKTFGLGFGLIGTTKGTFFFGIEGHYNNILKSELKIPGLSALGLEYSNTATLRDPSDDDTVEIEAYKTLAGYLTFGFNIIKSTVLTLYINAGGGVMFIQGAEEQNLTSSLGYETVIEPPDKKISPAGFAGAGISIGLIRAMALFVNLRYTYIHSLEETPLHQTAIVALVGVYFRF